MVRSEICLRVFAMQDSAVERKTRAPVLQRGSLTGIWPSHREQPFPVPPLCPAVRLSGPARWPAVAHAAWTFLLLCF